MRRISQGSISHRSLNCSVFPGYTRRDNQTRIFFKMFVDGSRRNVCVFSMDKKDLRSCCLKKQSWGISEFLIQYLTSSSHVINLNEIFMINLRQNDFS